MKKRVELGTREKLTVLLLCSAATARAKAIKSSTKTITKIRVEAMKTENNKTPLKLPSFAGNPSLFCTVCALEFRPTKFPSAVKRREKE